jgi:hypothetical protein
MTRQGLFLGLGGWQSDTSGRPRTVQYCMCDPVQYRLYAEGQDSNVRDHHTGDLMRRHRWLATRFSVPSSSSPVQYVANSRRAELEGVSGLLRRRGAAEGRLTAAIPPIRIRHCSLRGLHPFQVQHPVLYCTVLSCHAGAVTLADGYIFGDVNTKRIWCPSCPPLTHSPHRTGLYSTGRETLF